MSRGELGSQSQAVASLVVVVAVVLVRPQPLGSDVVSSMEVRRQMEPALQTALGKVCGTCLFHYGMFSEVVSWETRRNVTSITSPYRESHDINQNQLFSLQHDM